MQEEEEEPAPAPAPADPDDFERKLLAAMAAAEHGGGLASLGGGVQNSPPGTARAPVMN